MYKSLPFRLLPGNLTSTSCKSRCIANKKPEQSIPETATHYELHVEADTAACKLSDASKNVIVRPSFMHGGYSIVQYSYSKTQNIDLMIEGSLPLLSVSSSYCMHALYLICFLPAPRRPILVSRLPQCSTSAAHQREALKGRTRSPTLEP